MSDIHQHIIDMKGELHETRGDVAFIKGVVLRHDGQIAEIVPLLKLALTRRTRPERIARYVSAAALVILAGVAIVACMRFVR